MAAAGFLFGDGHDFLDFLDACKTGAEGDESELVMRAMRRASVVFRSRAVPRKDGAEIVVRF